MVASWSKGYTFTTFDKIPRCGIFRYKKDWWRKIDNTEALLVTDSGIPMHVRGNCEYLTFSRDRVFIVGILA